MAKATNVWSFLKDVDFPATKDELIGYAEESNVSEDMINQMDDRLEDRAYSSYTDVIKELVM